MVPLALLGILEGNIRWRRRRRKEELKKEGRKKMDSDSNTGSTGSTQIQYKHIGEIQNGNTVEIQGEAGQFGKKPVELLPASGNNETATQTTRSWTNRRWESQCNGAISRPGKGFQGNLNVNGGCICVDHQAPRFLLKLAFAATADQWGRQKKNYTLCVITKEIENGGSPPKQVPRWPSSQAEVAAGVLPTQLIVIARYCTLLHAIAHCCTLLYAIVRYCTRLHVVCMLQTQHTHSTLLHNCKFSSGIVRQTLQFGAGREMVPLEAACIRPDCSHIILAVLCYQYHNRISVRNCPTRI